MKKILILLSFVILYSCAAGGSKFSEINFEKPLDSAEIYVFRLNKFVDGGSCYEAKIDDEVIGVLANGGFIRKVVKPGAHEVAIPMINGERLNLAVSASSGESIYIQFNVALNSANGIPQEQIISTKSDYKYTQGELMNFYNLLVQVKPDYALQQMQALKDSSVKASCMATLKIKN